MTVKKLTVIPALLALSACGGGGSSGDATNVTPQTLSLTVPQATGEITQVQTIEAAAAEIPNLSEGDSVSLPISSTQNATITVGKTTDGITLLSSDFGNYSEILATSDLQSLANSVGTDPTNVSAARVLSATINGIDLSIEAEAGSNGYEGLIAEAGTSQATFFRESRSGGVYSEAYVGRNSDSFTKPSGTFGYSGQAALEVSDGLASGDTTMSVNFDAGVASISAPALTIEGSETTAGFSGNVNINNANGQYASSGATITVNDESYDAGIIGSFSGDATTSSGAVFDAELNTAAGVFIVVQD